MDWNEHQAGLSALVAQLVENLTCKQGVAGSIPVLGKFLAQLHVKLHLSARCITYMLIVLLDIGYIILNKFELIFEVTSEVIRGHIFVCTDILKE